MSAGGGGFRPPLRKMASVFNLSNLWPPNSLTFSVYVWDGWGYMFRGHILTHWVSRAQFMIACVYFWIRKTDFLQILGGFGVQIRWQEVSGHCRGSYPSSPTILSHKKWCLLVTQDFTYFSKYGFKGAPGGPWRWLMTIFLVEISGEGCVNVTQTLDHHKIASVA